MWSISEEQITILYDILEYLSYLNGEKAKDLYIKLYKILEGK